MYDVSEKCMIYLFGKHNAPFDTILFLGLQNRVSSQGIYPFISILKDLFLKTTPELELT